MILDSLEKGIQAYKRRHVICNTKKSQVVGHLNYIEMLSIELYFSDERKSCFMNWKYKLSTLCRCLNTHISEDYRAVAETTELNNFSYLSELEMVEPIDLPCPLQWGQQGPPSLLERKWWKRANWESHSFQWKANNVWSGGKLNFLPWSRESDTPTPCRFDSSLQKEKEK